ncbi:efflux RND transporter periplasmic adaptor subunit [Thalassomonas viridans]|uniref:Efflux RND transporter periplasmic adaptor subunit n=1 Tax=Thalassomonas viridans TaxID=137584 RepID=A0AAE9Z0E8_9GAMM|nr:efflux RND transporter periplasmic adaptor subunit [Thalassomonas viridans]WDE03800.1 efflux RND transporter periplasmic adaptor subunit [Thalassomonas viridans]
MKNISLFGVISLLVFSQLSLAQEAMKPGVVVTQVTEQDVTQVFSHVGRVVAIDKVDIRARVSGYLLKRHFVEGAEVQKGDLLFEIEADTYEITVRQRKADLASARANLKKSRAALKRQQDLKKRGVASEADLDQAAASEAVDEASVLKVQALLAEAELSLSYTKIYSPIDGKISQAVYSTGNLVGVDSGALATVTNMNPVYVSMSVSEKILLEARRQGIGQKTSPVAPTLKLSDGSDYTHTGEFDYLDTQVSESTDTILARAVFPNDEGILLPGEYVQVDVTPKEKKRSAVVPQSAVQKDQQGYFVLVVTPDNIVEVRRVELGAQKAGNWEVLTGLSLGEKIIIEGLQKVRAGAAVNPVEG